MKTASQLPNLFSPEGWSDFQTSKPAVFQKFSCAFLEVWFLLLRVPRFHQNCDTLDDSQARRASLQLLRGRVFATSQSFFRSILEAILEVFLSILEVSMAILERSLKVAALCPPWICPLLSLQWSRSGPVGASRRGSLSGQISCPHISPLSGSLQYSSQWSPNRLSAWSAKWFPQRSSLVVPSVVSLSCYFNGFFSGLLGR